jgi:hypothetical protein
MPTIAGRHDTHTYPGALLDLNSHFPNPRTRFVKKDNSKALGNHLIRDDPTRAGPACSTCEDFPTGDLRRGPCPTRRSRKEVIQPQVPLRLPCYDFAPVIELAFGRSLLAVGRRTSGAPDFHGVTGGVYKARERIHRGVADPRLLAIPASCSRVTDCNPNLDRVFPIRSPSQACSGLSRPL